MVSYSLVFLLTFPGYAKLVALLLMAAQLMLFPLGAVGGASFAVIGGGDGPTSVYITERAGSQLVDDVSYPYIYGTITRDGIPFEPDASCDVSGIEIILNGGDVVRWMDAEGAASGKPVMPTTNYMKVNTPEGYKGDVPTDAVEIVDLEAGRAAWDAASEVQTEWMMPRITPKPSGSPPDTTVKVAQFELEELLGDVPWADFEHTRTPDGRVAVEPDELLRLIESVRPGATIPPAWLPGEKDKR